MIQTHFTIYDTEQGTKFRVYVPDPENPTSLQDVTDQYSIGGCEHDDGRIGFVILKDRDPDDERHPTGAEL